MSVPRPHSSFWDQDCNCHVKVEEETQPRLLGSTPTPPGKPLLPEKSQRPVQIPSITPHKLQPPSMANPAVGPAGSPLQSCCWQGRGTRNSSREPDRAAQYRSTPQCPGTTLRDCKTEKPARPGQRDVGHSPLQEATPSLFVPGFILTCGSTSTRSQGTRLGQTWPRTQPPTSPLTAQFPTLQQRGKQEYP